MIYTPCVFLFRISPTSQFLRRSHVSLKYIVTTLNGYFRVVLSTMDNNPNNTVTTPSKGTVCTGMLRSGLNVGSGVNEGDVDVPRFFTRKSDTKTE